jgi:hypothetical protein
MLLTGFPGTKALFDAEVFPNYISLNFEDVDTGCITRFRITPTIDERIAAETHYRSQSVVVSYNGHGYDDHILKAAFAGLDCGAIHSIGDEIINRASRRFSPFLSHGEPRSGWPLSIDLAQITKIGKTFPGLKSLGLRLGYHTLQELPVAPGTLLTPTQADEVDEYNTHDLAVTRLVLAHYDSDVETRRILGSQCGVNLTSHSNGRLGEAVVTAAYTLRVNAVRLARAVDEEPDQFRISRPSKREWTTGGINLLDPLHAFTDPGLRALLTQVAGWTLRWKLSREGDQVELASPSFNAKIVLADKTYSFGMGGLHSEDGPLITESDADQVIIDIDASSFYPLLIKQNQLAPGHLDQAVFCDVYSDLTRRRLQAKRDGNTKVANGLKVAINAVYGKFSDRYSVLLDPPKGATVTLNGQFILLRLIEAMLAIDGLAVLSANTDGVLLRLQRQSVEQLHAAMDSVAGIYGVTFEEVEIDRLCRISINEYVLSYRDTKGERKIKARGGAFNAGEDSTSLGKKTTKRIVKQAANAQLLFGTPVTETIAACHDITAFADYSTLEKGWHGEDGDGNRLPQRTNRWYEATSGTKLHRVNADGRRQQYSLVSQARIINNLPDGFPDDINHEYYIGEAQRAVDAVLNPKVKKASRSKAFDRLTKDEREELDTRRAADMPDLDRLRSIDLDRHRDLYLGKHKFNFFDSMKSVLHMLWLTDWMRLTKADLIWCCDSIDSAQGYFGRRDKRRSIMSYIDWLVDNVVPIEKAVLPEDDAAVAVTVKVLDREPGGGNTRLPMSGRRN